MMTLYVPRNLVALVDRALRREGLEVFTAQSQGCEEYREVRLGAPLPDVPRLLAYDGPRLLYGERARHGRISDGCGVG